MGVTTMLSRLALFTVSPDLCVTCGLIFKFAKGEENKYNKFRWEINPCNCSAGTSVIVSGYGLFKKRKHEITVTCENK